jgi:hypothetical protein
MEDVPNGVSQQGQEMARQNEAKKEAANPKPTALPSEVMDSPDVAAMPVERALHLRVLAGMLGGQAEESRVEQALALAQEVYELERASVSLENYRSS